MFPLYFLGLLFIVPRTDDKKEERESGKEQEKERESKARSEQGYAGFDRGDVLEVSRAMFTHYGVYLGGGRVAHLVPDILPVVSDDLYDIGQAVTNTRYLLGILAKVASVRVDKVEDFANGSQVIVNHTDKLVGRSPLQGEEVARRAEKLLGPAEFSLLWWNCEHFAMYCRYASSMSFQSAQFCLKARKYLLRRASALLSAAIGLFLMFYLDVVSLLSIFTIFIISINVWMAV